MAVDAISTMPVVEAARSLIRECDVATLDEQIRLTSIPAPSGAEHERARYVQDRFREIGLEPVSTDEVGNVLGVLPRASLSPGETARPVLVTAHLDTIFPRETEIRVQREGKRIYAPGITDNGRGLAALLTIADVLRRTELETRLPVVFVATVGEEGLGDLKGVKHLFEPSSHFRKAAAFISIDGASSDRIVTRAIGSHRIRAVIRGPGGHSWADRGTVNPIHAIASAVAALRELRPPRPENSAVTVTTVSGGTSINSIPAVATLELDLRSEDANTLVWLRDAAHEILGHAVEMEAGRSKAGKLRLEILVVGDRPCGATPSDHRLVRSAIRATELVGVRPDLVASSTDSNVPISLGIPAVTIGAGGIGGGIHTTQEWYENEGGPGGIERAMLTLLGTAGVDQHPRTEPGTR